MTLGWHVIAEYEQCDKHKIDDIAYVEKHLNKAAELAGATIVKSVFHKFAPQGVSGVVVIQESHFAIHTWPEHDYAAIDLFTCTDKMNFEKALNYMKKVFGCDVLKHKTLKRGVDVSKKITHA
jgi:S-adenosylmethionine decarboxylase